MRVIRRVLSAAAALLVPAVAQAFEIRDLGANIAQQFGTLLPVANVIFVFLGFVLAGFGVIKIMRQSKLLGGGNAAASNDSAWWPGIAMLLFGSALLILVYITNMATQSTFGVVSPLQGL